MESIYCNIVYIISNNICIVLLIYNCYLVIHLFLARFQSSRRLNYFTYSENVIIKINLNAFKYIYIIYII